MTKLCRSAIVNLLPLPWGPTSIRNVVQIEELGEEQYMKENWKRPATVNIDDSIIGLIDPPLAHRLLDKLYPDTDRTAPNPRIAYESTFVYSKDEDFAKVALELEVRLCQITMLASYDGEVKGPSRAFLPFAAIVSDALKLISQVEAQMDSTDHYFATTRVLNSSQFYLSGSLATVDRLLAPELLTMQKRLKPAADLGMLDLLDILLFSSQRPGAQLTLEKSFINDGYGVVLNNDWLSASVLKKPKTQPTKEAKPDESLFDRVKDLKLNFSNIDAEFICSGRFRLMLTTRVEKHLTLDDDFNLHIFWDFNSYIGRDLGLIRHHFFWDRGATDDDRYDPSTHTSNSEG